MIQHTVLQHAIRDEFLSDVPQAIWDSVEAIWLRIYIYTILLCSNVNNFHNRFHRKDTKVAYAVSKNMSGLVH